MFAVKVGCDGRPKLERVPIPIPGPQDVLIKVLRAGICATDIQLLKGYVDGFNNILGHEFVGRVTQLGTEVGREGPEEGDIVVADINCQGCRLSEKMCAMCLKGGVAQRNHCCSRYVLGIRNKDGCMAEYLTMPSNNCHVIPANVSQRIAVFAEPLAAAMRITEQIKPTAQDKIAIIGDGKLGLLLAEVAHHLPHSTITIFGHHNNKMGLLRDDVIKVNTTVDGVETYSNSFDYVIEVTGTHEGIESAIEMANPLGTIIQKTTCAGESRTSVSKIVIKELTMIGSRCGDLKMALTALKTSKYNLKKYISHEFPLEDAVEAFKRAVTPGVIKVQLYMKI